MLKQFTNSNWLKQYKLTLNLSQIQRDVSHPLIYEYMKAFYVERVKIIPKNISDILKSNLSLAVWFMDDGNGYRRKNGFRISSYAFGLNGNQLLQNCLKVNFGLNVSIYKDTKGYQIYVPVNNGSASRFRGLIEPHIISRMRYKIERRSPVETNIGGTRYSGN